MAKLNASFARCAMCVALLAALTGQRSAAQMSASWQHVQTSAANAGGGTNVVTFSAPTTSGDLIVAEVDWSDGSSFLSLTDSQGNAYTQIGTEQHSASIGIRSRLYYARNIRGGTDTVTAIVSGTPQYHELYLHEYSGLDRTAPFDGFSVNVGNGQTFTSNPVTTTASNDLLYGIEIDSATSTSDAGWTIRSVLDSNVAADKAATAAGSHAFSGTSQGAFIAWVAAFRQASEAAPTDTTPPSVPTGLTATAVSTTQINLAWSASTDPDYPGSPPSYKIFRGGISVGTTAAGATTYQDLDRTPATTYSYTIAAFDAAGNTSAPSGAALATTLTPADNTAPTVPTELIAVPASASQVSLSWLPSSDNVGVAGYGVFRNGVRVSNAAATPSYVDTGLRSDTTYVYTVSAFDLAGNESARAANVVATTPPTGVPYYSTSFSQTENPIAEDGHWINGRSVGLDWADVSTAMGKAGGTQTGSDGFDDSTALLTGTWGADQTVQAVVHSFNQNDSYFEEVELRLRSSLSPNRNTGYEIIFRCSKTDNAYAQIVRWNGPIGDFTYLDSAGGSEYGVRDGDIVKATIAGNLITAYINDVQVLQVADDSYKTGNPGIGFYLSGAEGVNADFGFTSFTALSTAVVQNFLNLNKIGTGSGTVSSSPSGVDCGSTCSTSYLASTVVTLTAIPDSGNTFNGWFGAGCSGVGTCVVSLNTDENVTATFTRSGSSPPSVPANLSSVGVSSSQIELTWSASIGADDAVAGYTVFVNGVHTAQTAQTSYAVMGLSPSTLYTFTVSAYDVSGNTSARSSPSSATTLTPPPASWAHVQTTAANSGAGTNTVSFDSATRSGDLIVIEVDWSDGSDFVSVSDSQGNVFTQIGTEQHSTLVGVKSRLYYARNILGGPEVVTAVVTGSPMYHELYVHEYSGLDPTNPLESFSVQVGGGDSFTSAAVATTAENDLLFGIEIDLASASAAAGWRVRSVLDSNVAGDRNAPAAGNYAFTGGSTGGFIAWIAAFRQAGSAP